MLVTSGLCQGSLPLEDIVSRAIAGGVNAVQLRAPGAPALELWEIAKKLRTITRKASASLFINDRIDVAQAVGADGVQLGGRSLPPSAARPIAGQYLLLGRSVHTVEEVASAQTEGADFLVLGTIFATSSHPGRTGSGPDLVRHARQNTRLPIIGIGGINRENACQVIEAGADGIAIISAIMAASDPHSAAAELWEAIRPAR
jgi:thiamine-phosphate diphosphorylase